MLIFFKWVEKGGTWNIGSRNFIFIQQKKFLINYEPQEHLGIDEKEVKGFEEIEWIL